MYPTSLQDPARKHRSPGNWTRDPRFGVFERLEDRQLLAVYPTTDNSPDDGPYSFFVVRLDDLEGTIDQQIVAGQRRLIDAGLTNAKLRSSLGSEGLFVLQTTEEVHRADLNEQLSRVPGYKYLEAAQGNAQTGALTRVYQGRIEVNPLASLLTTRLDTGPLDPSAQTGGTNAPTTVLGSFTGLDANDNPFLLSPPDTIVAAGPNHVMEAVNIGLRIFDKSGTELSTQLLADFFAPVAPVNPFDPLVTYDTQAQRWVIASASFNGIGGADLLYAVSNTTDPLDGFTEMHKIEFGSFFFDFPKLGFNADSIVITGNLFNAPSLPIQIIAVDKTSVLDADSNTVTEFLSQRLNFRAMVPATMHGSALGSDVMYFVEEASYVNGSMVRVVKMTDVLTPAPVYTDHDIAVNAYGFPPAAQQPGGLINTNDTTFLNADWRNGRLVGAHSVGDFSDSDSHAAWYLFDAADSELATPSLIQQGRLDPGDQISTYYPSVAITEDGTIGMTYMQSSPAEFASMYVTGRTPGDPAGTTRDPALVAAGEDFLDGFFRAGDYSGITVDPVDGKTFWAANEYKAVDAFWSTAIAHFTLGMAVANTSPANGEIVTTRPAEYIVDFSDPYNPAQIMTSGMTVNGLPASTYTIIDEDTLSFTFASDPVNSQGLQTLDLAGGTVQRLSDDDPLVPYTGTFRYDALRMQVVSTVPANGSVATLPLTSLVVNLNEPYAPGSVSASDLTLDMGTVTGFQFVDADSIRFLLSGLNAEGTLSFSLAAGALTDVFGNPSLPYDASVTLDFGSVPLPTPTKSISPSGGLIYETSIIGNILPAGDTDKFTITVDPGQTITVIVEPTDATLRPKVVLSMGSGGNTQAGSATAQATGLDAVLQTVKVPGLLLSPSSPLNYQITVSGFAGTTGGYSVRLILNAAAELENHDGAANDSRATAQSLESGFLPLGTATEKAQRGAVVGRVRGGTVPGDAFVGVRSFNFFGGNVVRYDAAGNLVQTIESPEFDRGVISDVELGPEM